MGPQNDMNGTPIRKAWISAVELEAAARRTGVPSSALSGLHDQSVVDIGSRLRLTFRHTPGHSPGSMVVLVSDRDDKPLFMISGFEQICPQLCVPCISILHSRLSL